MKTVAEIIDMVEEYGRSERQGYQDWHERLADIERAIKEREARAWQPIETAPKDRVFLGWIRAERWSAEDGGGSGRSHDVSQGDFCWWRAVLGSPDGGYWDNGAGQIGDAQEVTNWMPLPAAPITGVKA